MIDGKFGSLSEGLLSNSAEYTLFFPEKSGSMLEF